MQVAPTESSDISDSVALAEWLLTQAEALLTRREQNRRARLGRMLADEYGRDILFRLTDEVMRFPDDRVAAASLRALRTRLDSAQMEALDRAGLRVAMHASRVAPHLVRQAVRARLLAETRGTVAVGRRATRSHLSALAGQGIEANVNLLGEAVLGDGEAEDRIAAVCELLERPDVSCVSVKASAVCANLDPLAFEDSTRRLEAAVRRIYDTALASTPPKLVYLDMEDYEELAMTVAVFTTLLQDPTYASLPVGIALQAYVPDSHGVLADLCGQAAVRARHGGAPVTVRLVKGPNLAMEQVRAELNGWQQAPYACKADVDASYKHLLEAALRDGAPSGLRVALASHNLFDIAWGLTLRTRLDVSDRLVIEMLSGMAPAEVRVLLKAGEPIRLYCPVVAKDDFTSAIAYLTRRLDENTTPENFLHDMFTLTRGSVEWRRQAEAFKAAVETAPGVSTSTRRTQDRASEQRSFEPALPFGNEPDTDFTTEANRTWGHAWLAADFDRVAQPVVDLASVDAMVAAAGKGAQRWATMTFADRERILGRAAAEMASGRGHTLLVMARETGKTIREGDPEVSEAIDMARWSIHCGREMQALAAQGVVVRPRGVVVIAGPWNFPYAIPANGVFSALAGGNAVLLKPAPEAVETGKLLIDQLHRAGVPQDVVQLAACPDGEVGRHLVCHPGVAMVVLTGSYATAEQFLRWKPSMRLIAETSGKNALVVTASADLDLAIADLVHSAFGHAGQKCSAASLAIVDHRLYDAPRFCQRLTDAASSLRVGDATDVATMMGPLIHPPEGPLLRALTELDDGESWLVTPRQLDQEGRLWSPGVKFGVKAGSWFHRTECFGPVLGVMRAESLDDAIQLQNAVEFGLTGGLHSLDAEEIERWLAAVEVGNAYVNRHITGAIVRRQPFGGWKRSSVGPTAKAGGPDYLWRFVEVGAAATVSAVAAEASYDRWWQDCFSREVDASGLRAESNVLRYRPLDKVLVRVDDSVSVEEVAMVRTAAALVGTPMELSASPNSRHAEAVGEDDEALAARVEWSGAVRLRSLGHLDERVLRACHAANVAVDDTPVTGHGRIELPCWLKEQSISRTLHRYGRLTPTSEDRP